MEPAIERLYRKALEHSRQSIRLWKRAMQLLDPEGAEDLFTRIEAAIEISERAIEECKKALNTFDFLRRYPQPAGRPDSVVKIGR